MIDALKRCEVFAELDDEALGRLASVAAVRKVDEGASLFRVGEPCSALLVVVAGRLSVHARRQGRDQTVAVVGPGDVLGTHAALGPSLHGVSAVAQVASEVLALEAGDLHRVLDEASGRAVPVLTEIGRIVARRLRYASGWDETPFPPGARLEHDLLGERQLPADALYGVQTLRAVENFDISGTRLSQFPVLIRALARVKQACARANLELGLLDEPVAAAIHEAGDELVAGRHHGHFVVDMMQGGAGTSTNMNANEVLANRALDLLGHPRGAYDHCHPNNHVNLSQSTNDVYPTALRLATLLALDRLLEALAGLRDALHAKADELDHVLKMGRTQLQDAVPMTLGQEFRAFAVTTDEDIQRLRETANLFHEINLGGTAIGTGINADPDYAPRAVAALAELTGQPFVLAADLVEATPDTGAFVMFSGVLKRAAVKLSKLCNDLRLLSSGPRCGFGEIELPPMQPGSSIMPGKVNPVIPEVVNQVAFRVIGNDLTLTMAAEAGQLQLNVMEPVIALSLFESMGMLRAAVVTLTERCVVGIRANEDRCREHLDRAIGVVTATVPYVGYERAGEVAAEALRTGRSVRQILLESGDLSAEQLDAILSVEGMTRPRSKMG